MSRRRLVLGIVLLALLATTVAGALALSFECDDAYINYRYVANAHAGLGMVWNPPPFRPVEGYTSPLWICTLWATWSLFGAEPPAAANVLSILFGVGQFALIAAVAFGLRRRDGARAGDVVAIAVVACVVAQRTFLQWMTSGFETAMLNLYVVGWVLLAFRARERRDTRWLFFWSTLSALAALTRPDGLVTVGATAVAALPALATRRIRSVAVGLSPLAIVAVHFLWRRSFYGEWLPNTYYAKVVAPWPEAGIPYFGCFLFETGLWLWFPVALVWLLRDLVLHRRTLVATWFDRVPAVAAVGVLAFHVGYYSLVVGGDHFEYRVLSQLVPLAWLSLAAMAVQLLGRPLLVCAALVPMLAASTIGWVHYSVTRDVTLQGIGPLAPRVPAFLRSVWRWHDSAQRFLHMHWIGLRCEEHVLALAKFRAAYPARGTFAPPGYDDVPVVVERAVGIAGWVLSDCAIVDHHGLNDWVVARTPPADWRLVPGVAELRDLMVKADVDGDGYVDRAELQRWCAVWTGFPVTSADADPIVNMAFDLFATERREALSHADCEAFVRGMLSRGAMAHEHTPPPGYVEAFEPNVVVTPTSVVVTPRATPLAPRIPAIEAEWRAKQARGELKPR